MNDTVIDFKLTNWQKEVFLSDARFKVVVAGRRCGKTRLSAIALITKATQCPSMDARVMYVAPTQGMAYDLMWQLVMMLAEPLIAKAHINDGDITLKNGIMIQIRGADKPDRLRGKKLYYAILDEMKDIKTGTWESSIRPSLADMEGGALFIGTPAPEADEFRKYYDFGQEDDDKYDPEWKSWHFTTADNPYIKKSEILAAKNSMGAAEFFREFEASWDTTGANVLRLEWFKTAKAPLGEYSTYIAIDPAGYENVSSGKKTRLDYFAIAVVRVYDNGHWWVQKIDYGRWDVRESAVRVLMAIRTHKPIAVGIEKGSLMRALMPYLEDLMRKNQVFAHIHQIPTASTSKINRITYALQGLLEHGRITFNPDENWDELKKEMIGFPSERVHDDLLDVLAQIFNLNTTTYGKESNEPDWEPLDEMAGV
ncbi:MAG TPA: terminase family protein [Candidatus Methylomirabilis sp.]|nr:terminase family protein [Candidatus Methylomirabilis sp.]